MKWSKSISPKSLFYRCRLPNSDYISRLTFLTIDSLSFRRTVSDLVIVQFIIFGNMDFIMEQFVFGQPSSSRGLKIKLRLLSNVVIYWPTIDISNGHFITLYYYVYYYLFWHVPSVCVARLLMVNAKRRHIWDSPPPGTDPPQIGLIHLILWFNYFYRATLICSTISGSYNSSF